MSDMYDEWSLNRCCGHYCQCWVIIPLVFGYKGGFMTSLDGAVQLGGVMEQRYRA